MPVKNLRTILSVLGRFVSELSAVKFFLTRCLEQLIHASIRLPLLVEVTDMFVLHVVDVEPSVKRRLCVNHLYAKSMTSARVTL